MTSTSPETRVQSPFEPFIYLGGIAAVNLVAPFVPIPNAVVAILSTLLLTIVYVGLVVGLGLSISRKQFSVPKALVYTGAAIVVWLFVEWALRPMLRPHWIELRLTGARPTTGLLLQTYGSNTLQDVALMAGASLVGTILAKMIKHANMLGPIGAAVALIDIWGVLFGGIVSQMLTNKATQPLAERAMAAGPRVGVVNAARPEFSISVPAIGVGDFLFIALLLSVLVNLAMNWKTSAKLMWIFVAAALLSINFLPFFPHLPGLLFIAGAVILPNLKYFTFTREERFALLYAGIFVVLLTGGLYLGFTKALPPEQKPMPRQPAAVRNAPRNAPAAPRTN